jgi:hypothetical protein
VGRSKYDFLKTTTSKSKKPMLNREHISASKVKKKEITIDTGN